MPWAWAPEPVSRVAPHNGTRCAGDYIPGGVITVSHVAVPLSIVAGVLLVLAGCAPTSSPSTAATPGLAGPPATQPAVSASPSAPVSPSPSAAVAGASAATVQMTDALRFDPAT